jgi:hypothetical protein
VLSNRSKAFLVLLDCFLPAAPRGESESDSESETKVVLLPQPRVEVEEALALEGALVVSRLLTLPKVEEGSGLRGLLGSLAAVKALAK